jgi:hypothetical protein
VSKHLSPERNKLGAAGEQAVSEFLGQRFGLPYVHFAERDLQIEHIDYVVRPPGVETIYIEVKADQHVHKPGGNFAFELFRVKHNAPLNHRFYPAWGINSRANFLIVYSTETGALYIVDMPHLRERANRYIQAHRAQTRIAVVYTDDDRTSFNVLVPKSMVDHQVWQQVGAGEWSEVAA